MVHILSCLLHRQRQCCAFGDWYLECAERLMLCAHWAEGAHNERCGCINTETVGAGLPWRVGAKPKSSDRDGGGDE